MSRRYGAWKLLGLDKMSDTAAIRSAYARALKALDVDADPRGFQALRDARKQALAQARHVDAELDCDEEAEEDEADGSFFVASPASPETPAAQLDTDPHPAGSSVADNVAEPVDDHVATMEAHYRAIMRLLFERTGDSPHLDAADEMTLSGHVEALLADPRLEGIDFHRQAETWFSDVAASAIPRSDPMIPRVTDYFGWTAERGRIGQPPAIARCVNRRDSLKFFELVQQRQHPLNAAWRMLCKPMGGRDVRNLFLSNGQVRRLLGIVRKHFPDLESCFDPQQVSLWEGPKPRATGWRPFGLAIFFLIAVVRLAIGGFGSDTHHRAPLTSPAYVQVMGDKHADIDLGLMNIAGGTIWYDDIVAQNPKLDAQLSTEWGAALDAHTPRESFAAQIVSELRARYRGGIGEAPRIALLELRQLERDKLATLRKISGQACYDWYRGKPMPRGIARTFDDRDNALTKHILMTTFAPMQIGVQPRSKFSVPGPVLGDAAKRAGLTRDQLVAALNDKSSPDRVCGARIGLLDTVIALPGAEGTRLLRVM